VAKQSGFLKEFFKEKKTVGALAPSSKFLMRRMLKDIDFSKAKVIVELGPGNGVFTKGILDRMAPDAILFSFELNENFCNYIRKTIKDDRLVLLNQSAEHIGAALKEYNFHKTDYIISSLPLAVIPKEVKENVLIACTKYLDPDGLYVQFQYSLNAKKLLKETFKQVDIKFAPVNIPPAFVYTCKP